MPQKTSANRLVVFTGRVPRWLLSGV